MNPDTELQDAYDDVLRKIGRNLLMFQKAEQLLKHLLTLGNFKVTDSEPTSYEEQASIWHKQTMGSLIMPFLEKHCSGKDPLANFPSDSAGISLASSFTLGVDAAARQKALAVMVNERNELVHHLFFKIDRNSVENCREIADYLDAQRENALPVIERLQEEGKFVTTQLSELCAFLTSDEGQAMLRLTGIQQCPVIAHLAAAAGNNKDAWISLKTEVNMIPADCIEPVEKALARFNFKTLTELLEASEMFDYRRSAKGQTFYRLKATE